MNECEKRAVGFNELREKQTSDPDLGPLSTDDEAQISQCPKHQSSERVQGSSTKPRYKELILQLSLCCVGARDLERKTVNRE
jgi:hypothetical protein